MSEKKTNKDFRGKTGFIRDQKSHNTDCYSNQDVPSTSADKEGYDSALTVPPGKAVFESFGDHQPIKVKSK